MHSDLIDAQIGMRAIRQPDGAGRARYLLHGDTVFEVTKTGAAPFLLDGDAVNAERAERGPQVAGKGVAAVYLVGARCDFLGRKGSDALAQHVCGLAQAKAQTVDTTSRHLRSPLQSQPNAAPLMSALRSRSAHGTQLRILQFLASSLRSGFGAAQHRRHR